MSPVYTAVFEATEPILSLPVPHLDVVSLPALVTCRFLQEAFPGSYLLPHIPRPRGEVRCPHILGVPYGGCQYVVK